MNNQAQALNIFELPSQNCGRKKECTSIGWTGAGENFSQGLTYNANTGNIDQITRELGIFDYTYDSTDQLTSVDYDEIQALGNLVTDRLFCPVPGGWYRPSTSYESSYLQQLYRFYHSTRRNHMKTSSFNHLQDVRFPLFRPKVGGFS